MKMLVIYGTPLLVLFIALSIFAGFRVTVAAFAITAIIVAAVVSWCELTDKWFRG